MKLFSFRIIKVFSILLFVHGQTIAQNAISRDSLYHPTIGEKIYLDKEVDSIAIFRRGEYEMYNFIFKNIKYPQDARKNVIEGKVYSSFIVEKDGRISDKKIIKGVYKSLDNEVLKMLSIMPNEWKPAYKNGYPVRMQFILPVNFTLDESAKQKH